MSFTHYQFIHSFTNHSFIHSFISERIYSLIDSLFPCLVLMSSLDPLLLDQKLGHSDLAAALGRGPPWGAKKGRNTEEGTSCITFFFPPRELQKWGTQNLALGQ